MSSSQEMDIDKTNTDSDQFVSFDKKQKFIKFNGRGRWQCSQQRQDFNPVRKTATGQFADNERVAHHFGIIQ